MKNIVKFKDFIFMSQRQRTSPFPNYMSMESVCKEMKQYTGEKLDKCICIWQGNILFAFPHAKSLEKAGKSITKKITNNPKFVTGLITKQKKFGKLLVDFTKKVNKEVGSKISDKKLYEIFAEYEKRYKQVYATYGWVWITEDVFAAELLKIVEKRIKNKTTSAVDALNILTTEPSAMVATLERKALLELALKINKKKNWKEEGRVKDLIAKHVGKYFWLTRDYEDPVITTDDVVNRLNKVLRKDVEKEYQNLIDSLAKNESLRKKYLKELEFTEEEKKLFTAMRDIAYLKEQRKTNVSKSLYYFDKVLEEIGKRLYLSIKQVRFMKTSEVKEALINGKDFTTELNNRLKLSVWDCQGKGTDVITGNEAEKIFNEFCKVDKSTLEFSGLPVSPGKARGPAKIVMNPDECNKVKKGDIIVTVQVVPSFSTAIIKSAGLICDGGHGITSHPATLAREAGIPCVIQTRFAREIIKDGDIVEVDGYKGIAKIIKK